ncbi:MAG: hypothetical protein ACK4TK_12800 [Thiobacillaceae bacterium]
MTKSVISQLQRIKASALAALNQVVVAEAEAAGDSARWMGHRLLAVDGSGLRLHDLTDMPRQRATPVE